jgi:protein-disulfide isomerase
MMAAWKGVNREQRDMGIRARPTFDVNGEIIVGAVSFEAFQSVIQPMLAAR